ncbi:MAG TPA: OmpH family outer membrane protein [Gemmatimonadaceae bacterium]|nr:OmpH family outer membrane protein [Gemmatimonadaceae bacterium]
MHSFVRAGVVALALFAVAPVAVQAQGTLKFAYIDSRALLAQAPGRAEAEAQFQKEMASYQQQVQKMGDSLNTMMAAYTKAELTLSPAAKEARQKTIRDKEAAYQERVQGLQEQAQQRQGELMGPIMQLINTAISDVRAQDGYSFIFDVGAQGGVVVAADTTLNITDKVLARLKTISARPASSVPVPNAGAPMTTPAGIAKPKP